MTDTSISNRAFSQPLTIPNVLRNRLRQFIKSTILFVALLTSLPAMASELELTQAEHQWLSNHSVIRMSPKPDFKPFEWVTSTGEFNGMAADYMQLIEEKLGIRFELVERDNLSQLMQLINQHQLDILPAISHSKAREKHMLFTDSYISVPGILVSSLNHMGINQLADHQVAVVRDSIWDERLTAAKTGIIIKRVDNLSQGLNLAALGSVEAMITDLASATSMIEQENINNLHIMSDASQKLGNLELAIGVRTDWPEFHTILNKALASIDSWQIKSIRSKWIKFQQPAFWQNREFWYYTLTIFVIILALFSSFFIWNRTLKKQVNLQSRELHAAQSLLMQAEKMESVGRLAAGVAHEVKNPLAIIQLGVDYLSREIPDEPTATEVIKDIGDAVQRANAVILGLLDFSHEKTLELNPGNVNQVILTSLHLVEHELRQRHIKVETRLMENIPSIALDANKLQQVFINLFINSAHAMKHEGTLLITSKLSIISDKTSIEQHQTNIFHLGEQVIQVEVADSGHGIHEPDKAKIFDLFYTTKGVGEGTGLGLSVSRNIVNLHHGSIDITNRPEGGASVMLLFKLD